MNHKTILLGFIDTDIYTDIKTSDTHINRKTHYRHTSIHLDYTDIPQYRHTSIHWDYTDKKNTNWIQTARLQTKILQTARPQTKILQTFLNTDRETICNHTVRKITDYIQRASLQIYTQIEWLQTDIQAERLQT